MCARPSASRLPCRRAGPPTSSALATSCDACQDSQTCIAEARHPGDALQHQPAPAPATHSALAFHRSRLLGGALYGWFAVTQHRAASKRAAAAAALHWAARRRRDAFAVWRDWATQRRELMARAAGLALVRAARAKANALLALQ
jgi:hypothetical protein